MFLMLVVVSLEAQKETSYLEIVKAESQLNQLFKQLYNQEDYTDKDRLYLRIDSLFQDALEQPGSYDYAWTKLDMIGKLKSDDGALKVFSWLYMKSRDEYKYTCYMQVSRGKGKSETFRMSKGKASGMKTEDYQQTRDNWHPKIYYQLITSKYKRKTFYTLLGADFNNSLSSIKTAEVLAVQRGKPVFRGAQFLHGGTVKNRIIFEYSAELTMTLRYNPQLKQIVFDHLAPLHPLYTGSYQFYGPDGSYDGLKFIEGIWVYEEDVDARNISF